MKSHVGGSLHPLLQLRQDAEADNKGSWLYTTEVQLEVMNCSFVALVRDVEFFLKVCIVGAPPPAAPPSGKLKYSLKYIVA